MAAAFGVEQMGPEKLALLSEAMEADAFRPPAATKFSSRNQTLGYFRCVFPHIIILYINEHWLWRALLMGLVIQGNKEKGNREPW